MRKLLFALFLACAAMSVHAIDFASGTYYFDNSKMQMPTVQFIAAAEDGIYAQDLVLSETEPDRWVLELEDGIASVSEYAFCEHILDSSTSDMTIAEVVALLDNEESPLKHTERTSKPLLFSNYPIPGWVFYPTVSTNNAHGYWRTTISYTAAPSGTLPVLHVNTTDGEPIVSKDYYLKGTCWLDNMGLEQWQSVGTEAKPLALQIKGRGNSSWIDYDKKPYRIKLDKKNALMGLAKSKHYVLMAYAGERGWGYALDEMGFEVSRRMGLDYTVKQEPIELILNGEYMGLYWLAEKIRVDDDHVSIVEQADGETDPEKITGGWLVEIDNYDEPGQVKITSGNGRRIRFTPHSPEDLSAEQREYLTNLVTSVDNAIYNEDKNSREWESYIEMESVVKFYLVNEIIANAESFAGSCYWFKDQGSDTKIHFGPAWDFGNSFGSGYSGVPYNPDAPVFIYSYPYFAWLGELAKFPRFQYYAKKYYNQFIQTNDYNSLEEYLNNFAEKIDAATQCENLRWTAITSYQPIRWRQTTYKKYLKAKIDFLDSEWKDVSTSVDNTVMDGIGKLAISSVANGVITLSQPMAEAAVYDCMGRSVGSRLVNGRHILTEAASGVYFINGFDKQGNRYSTKVVIR